MIVLYSTGCPKCKILKEKLDAAKIQYIEISNVDRILEKGIAFVPVLEVCGERMNFMEANRWMNQLAGEGMNEHQH